MSKKANNNQIYSNVEDYEKNCYLASPSISKRRVIQGKPYFVKRYFNGYTDFEETMKKLAINQANKEA